MIGYSTFTMPTELEGLSLKMLNDACLMKMGWSLKAREQSICSEVLLGKYGRD